MLIHKQQRSPWRVTQIKKQVWGWIRYGKEDGWQIAIKTQNSLWHPEELETQSRSSNHKRFKKFKYFRKSFRSAGKITEEEQSRDVEVKRGKETD